MTKPQIRYNFQHVADIESAPILSAIHGIAEELNKEILPAGRLGLLKRLGPLQRSSGKHEENLANEVCFSIYVQAVAQESNRDILFLALNKLGELAPKVPLGYIPSARHALKLAAAGDNAQVRELASAILEKLPLKIDRTTASTIMFPPPPAAA